MLFKFFVILAFFNKSDKKAFADSFESSLQSVVRRESFTNFNKLQQSMDKNYYKVCHVLQGEREFIAVIAGCDRYYKVRLVVFTKSSRYFKV